MGDPEEDGGCAIHWLSYAELAETRRISKRAAIRLAKRHGWPLRKGQDGAARVAVPISECGHGAESQPVERSRGSKGQVPAEIDERVRALTAELGVMRSQITDLRLREATARNRAPSLAFHFLTTA